METTTDRADSPVKESSQPLKRKRVYRKRPIRASDDEISPPPVSSITAFPSLPNPSKDKETAISLIRPPSDALKHNADSVPSIQDIVRQRKAARGRRTGIEFTKDTTDVAALLPSATMVAEKSDEAMDEVATDIEKLVSRFAPQTGHVAEVTDKHMMAYVDAEMAKQQQAKMSSTSSTDFANHGEFSTNNLAKIPDGKQPAALGRIHEIDLGPASKERTIALTEAAKHRRDLLKQGQDPDAEDPEKPRLRRDGKPFRRRKRRTSADIQRDKLVEEVLRESRLDIYDENIDNRNADKKARKRKSRKTLQDEDVSKQEKGPEFTTAISPAASGSSASSSASDTSSASEAADDRIAEQFRRDFMEQVQARRRQRAPPSGKAKEQQLQRKQQGADSGGRGPKLGGSRSARAKVREREKEEAAAAGKRR